ncbi:MAG: hypothetical protein L0Y62_04360 [Nitrospirae bacterium]|nr:hypothetical protein [Nitrospirota bacterium]
MTTVEIKSDIDYIAADIIKAAIQAEIKRLEFGLRKTEQQIAKFENKYKIPSETFLAKFAAEDMNGGDAEFIEWAGELKVKDKIISALKRLVEIQYVTH